MNSRWRQIANVAAAATDDISRCLPAPIYMIEGVRFLLEFGPLGGARWAAEFRYMTRGDQPVLKFGTSGWRSSPEAAARLLVRETRRAALNSQPKEHIPKTAAGLAAEFDEYGDPGNNSFSGPDA